MSSLVGLRVVHGPDWVWGDQDGGDGCVGTVIATSDSDKKLFGPRTITVGWDTGMKACYQGTTEGFYYSLRIVNNAATGVNHPNIPCGNDLCWVQEIQGICWQYVTCNINLCTSCFMHKLPHHSDHNQFKRYENDRVKTPPIVSCWIGDGPESRTELKGIYPGANVSLEPEWPYGRENEMKCGVVIAAPKEEISGKDFVVEWLPSKERTRFQRGSTGGKLYDSDSPALKRGRVSAGDMNQMD